jgi:hypothetical protein
MKLPMNGRMTTQTAPIDPLKMTAKKIDATIERADPAKAFFMVFAKFRL